jgi:hypothetical protein
MTDLIEKTLGWLDEQLAGRVSLPGKARTVLVNTAATTSYKALLTAFVAHIVNGQRVLMETCWLPALDSNNIEVFISAMADAASSGCAIVTNEFKGAASWVPRSATAFGLRRDHVLVEIIASFDDHSDPRLHQRHQQWVQTTLDAFKAMALPRGYPNLLPRGNLRAVQSSGENAGTKRRYDPENIFRSTSSCRQRSASRRQSD